MSEFYLKILSGNHQGAEIPLEEGRHSLGKGDNCDLILTDAALHDLELTIELSEEGLVRLLRGDSKGPLYLNGQPSDHAQQVKPFDIVTSSGLFFTLGPADGEWPDLTLPELHRSAPTEAAAPGLGEDQTIDDDDFFPSTEEDEEVQNPLLTPETDEPELRLETQDEEAEYLENPFAEIGKKWLIGVPLSLIILVFTFTLFLFSSGSNEEVTVEKNNLDKAKEARIYLSLKDVKLKELPDQSILVTGYTSTQQEKQSLQQLFQERGIPFSSQLVVMNELRANADALLKSKGYKSLSLELDNTPGSLVLTGYVPTNDELIEIVNSLKQEIHGLVSIVDQVENQAGRVNSLKSMLREKGLSPRVHLIQKPNLITIEGHLLDGEQVYNLNDVVNRFRKRYGNRPALRTATRSAIVPQGNDPSQSTPTSLQIRGVSMGRVPYVIMEDGQKYLVGAKLANGYIIEDINLEYLLLSNGTDRIKYRLGGNGGQPIK